MNEKQVSEPESVTSKDDFFPVKLFKILSNPDYEDMITWLPHGRSWKVLDAKRLEKEVIPMFFRHRNFGSFMRQVTGWAFRRIPKGAEKNSYHHEKFLRGKLELCKEIRRPSCKKKITYPVDVLAPEGYRLAMPQELEYYRLRTSRLKPNGINVFQPLQRGRISYSGESFGNGLYPSSMDITSSQYDLESQLKCLNRTLYLNAHKPLQQPGIAVNAIGLLNTEQQTVFSPSIDVAHLLSELDSINGKISLLHQDINLLLQSENEFGNLPIFSRSLKTKKEELFYLEQKKNSKLIIWNRAKRKMIASTIL